MHVIELTDEELGVAEDLRLAAEYGTEWDMVLEGVAEKLEAAEKAMVQNGYKRNGKD